MKPVPTPITCKRKISPQAETSTAQLSPKNEGDEAGSRREPEVLDDAG